MTLSLRYTAATDVGLLRKDNQDAAYAGPHLVAVADGMGGQAHGEVASAVAIDTLKELDEDPPSDNIPDALQAAVHRANNRLRAMGEQDATLQSMGTTLTALLWSGERLHLAHVGDSRAYVLRGGELGRATKDHSLVQSLLDEGHISAEEAASHPQRALILRAIDGRGEVDADIVLQEAGSGDRWLLCSDGLSDYVTDDAIGHVLADYADIDAAGAELIRLANAAGGGDNITCVLADLVEAQAPQTGPVVVGTARDAASGGSTPGSPAGWARLPDTAAGDRAMVASPTSCVRAPTRIETTGPELHR